VIHAGAIAHDSAGTPAEIVATNVLGTCTCCWPLRPTWSRGWSTSIRDKSLDLPKARGSRRTFR
jgi:hypothetical protein